SAGYREPSLVFLFGTSTRLTDSRGAADFLLEGSCRFAFIDAKHERAFVQRAEAIGLRYAPGPRIEGINYSNGHWLSIAVYRSEGSAISCCCRSPYACSSCSSRSAYRG